ncbi:hypothetical protein DPMN_026217 [Dreissena polymorpha]|uniref:C2H2-type domain-containing protein n=1 Tax=Dreissena polymorpha TaxID=45954 RepID=A0A9D4RE28_DREPO|nr:hypothetical protein DPMN_026217 [Dreissena polymorpha]
MNGKTAIEKKRQARKARATNPPGDIPLIPCPTCSRKLRARIGLFSHLCTHRQTRSQTQGLDH